MPGSQHVIDPSGSENKDRNCLFGIPMARKLPQLRVGEFAVPHWERTR